MALLNEAWVGLVARENNMRKATTNITHVSNSGSRGKKTSIGRRNFGTATLNKHKRRMRGKSAYRGQG